MNKVILMGRLTRDPDVRYSQGPEPQAFARYTLAVDRRIRRDNNDPNAQTADFISCVAFGKSAQFAEQYLRKGTKIAITGRIQTGKYTNREGQTVYTTDVFIEDQEFAESKNANGGGEQNQSYSAPAPAQPQQYQAQPQQYQAPAPQAAPAAPNNQYQSEGGFINIPPDIDLELPFR